MTKRNKPNKTVASKQNPIDSSNKPENGVSEAKEGDVELIQELKKAGVDSQTITRIAQLKLTHYSGPLPHPEILKAFNIVIPCAGDRIVDQFEQEAIHRRQQEEKTLDANIEGMRSELNESKRGQWMGYSLSLLIIIFAFILGILGKEIAASIITSVGVAGMVTVFVVGKKFSKNDKEAE